MNPMHGENGSRMGYESTYGSRSARSRSLCGRTYTLSSHVPSAMGTQLSSVSLFPHFTHMSRTAGYCQPFRVATA